MFDPDGMSVKKKTAPYWEATVNGWTYEYRVTGKTKREAWEKLSALVRYHHDGLAEGILMSAQVRQRRTESLQESIDTTEMHEVDGSWEAVRQCWNCGAELLEEHLVCDECDRGL